MEDGERALAGVNEDALEVVPQEGLTEDPADRWLVWLRWVAVFGMAATIVVASLTLEALDIVPLMSVLLAIGASNLVWYVAVTSASRRKRPAEATPRYVELQLGVDVVSLGLMLWFAGGIENPFVGYLVFQIALAGLLCTPRATLLIALLTVGIAAALALAPPLPPVPSGLLRTATWVSIASLATLLAVFVAVYARRLSQLRAEGARNEKLAVLGRLVGMMSHELNTPLATISLLAEELHQFHPNLTPAELDEMLGSIAREAKRAHEIVGLVRGHVASDQSPEPVDVGVFVQEHAAAELARLGFGGKVSFDVEDGVVAHVLPRALLQVLVNVLKNATEASLATRGKVIEVGVKRRGRRVDVLVEDRGPGFSPEVLARVGEPFSTTKEGTGGMGMGLFISALLANRMGAKLSVATRPTGGARVVLSLPAESSGVARDTQTPGPSVGEREKLLEAP
jgi:two-component system, sensor histidine kinase RegB